MLFPQSYRRETVLRIVAEIAVPVKRVVISYSTKTREARSITRVAFVLLFTVKS